MVIDIMYFKTCDNEYIRLERLIGDTFKIFSGNYPESFAQCQAFEIKKQVECGNWIELDESKYKNVYS